MKWVLCFYFLIPLSFANINECLRLIDKNAEGKQLKKSSQDLKIILLSKENKIYSEILNILRGQYSIKMPKEFLEKMIENDLKTGVICGEKGILDLNNYIISIGGRIRKKASDFGLVEQKAIIDLSEYSDVFSGFIGEEECPKMVLYQKNFKSYFNFPLYDQSCAGICYAFALETILDYKFLSKGFDFSKLRVRSSLPNKNDMGDPLWLGILDYIGFLESPVKLGDRLDFEGGDIPRIYKGIQKNGICKSSTTTKIFGERYGKRQGVRIWGHEVYTIMRLIQDFFVEKKLKNEELNKLMDQFSKKIITMEEFKEKLQHLQLKKITLSEVKQAFETTFSGKQFFKSLNQDKLADDFYKYILIQNQEDIATKSLAKFFTQLLKDECLKEGNIILGSKSLPNLVTKQLRFSPDREVLKKQTYQEILQEISKRNPVLITFLTSILLPSTKKPTGPSVHSSVIFGMRRNRNSCEVLIKNTWGNFCKYDDRWECYRRKPSMEGVYSPSKIKENVMVEYGVWVDLKELVDKSLKEIHFIP